MDGPISTQTRPRDQQTRMRPNSQSWWGGASLLAIFLAGCGGAGPQVAPAPQSAPNDAESAALGVLPEEILNDSAADEAALSAIRDLEFHSLAKGGGHIRGILTAPDSGLLTAPSGPLQSRGGAAMAGGAKYDLNVESFVGHRRVKYYVDFFLGPSRDRFTIWLGRLARYEGMIQRRFRQYGLPNDLVYLALIESGYSNTAVSRARAVGMWQFIASTGRRYGLRIDDWVDERRDPFMATDAAARHLADLKDAFGAWYLAAAAYNGGEGRVTRGLRRLNTDENSDETFFALSDRRYLRRETRDYVPKLIAATLIAKDPELYEFDSIPALDPLVFDEITVPGQTGLDVIALLADTTTRSIQELNPHFYRGATPPGEQATVRVPRGKGSEVVQLYAELPPEDRVNFIEHRIRRGETLGVIARRYGVRLDYIEAANPGIRPRRLRIGQRITIPVSPNAQRSSRASGRSRIARASTPPNGLYMVRRGDTLWILAQRYGVTVSDLRRWNDIPNDRTVLQVGDRLRVASPQ